MKTCSRCRVHKPLSDFHPDPKLSFGVGGWCRDCKNAAVRKRYQEIVGIPKPALREKQCSTCKATKPATDFTRCPGKLDGLSSRCKACRKKSEDPARMTPERLTRARLRWGYGMTIDDLERMLDSQHNRCAICETPLRRPCIDHDHSTGLVRAILCNRCNCWLAVVEHPTFIAQATAYITQHRTAPPSHSFRANQKFIKARTRNAAEHRKISYA